MDECFSDKWSWCLSVHALMNSLCTVIAAWMNASQINGVGVHALMNSLRAVIAAWMNASQINGVGV